MSKLVNIFAGFLATLLGVELAEASAITAWTHPTSPGAQVTLTRSGGLDIVSTPTDLWGNWASDTRAFSPFMRKGETLYAQIDSGTTHFRNSFIIDTAGLSGINYPADAFLTPDTNSTSLSVHEVWSSLEIPDTMIQAYLWAGIQPSKVESTRVGRGLNSTTYHGVFLGLQSDFVIKIGSSMHYLLQATRNDTTFQTKGSFSVNKPYDGNARLIDEVDFPAETIPPTNILEEKLLHENPHPTATFVKQFKTKGYYDVSGRKVIHPRTGVCFNPTTHQRKVVYH